MNNKLLLIPIVSLGAIVQLPQGAWANAISADVVGNSEGSLEVSTLEPLGGSTKQSVVVPSMSTPEVTTDFQAKVPKVAPQVSSPHVMDSQVASRKVIEPQAVVPQVVAKAAPVPQVALRQVIESQVIEPQAVADQAMVSKAAPVVSQVASRKVIEPQAIVPQVVVESKAAPVAPQQMPDKMAAQRTSSPIVDSPISNSTVSDSPVRKSITHDSAVNDSLISKSTMSDSTVSDSPIEAQATPPSNLTITPPVKIEIGTSATSSRTDLSARIALPPDGLLPGNLEVPINMGQVADSSITTSSPITDRLASPALSAHLQTVQTFMATKPEAMDLPCASSPTANCSPMRKPVNLEAYQGPGLSLRSEDPAVDPDIPSAIGPIVRERLRITVDEVQADRSAYSQNLVAWSDRVRQCMNEKPRLYVLRSDGAQLPVFFNSQEGTVIRNEAGHAVCPN